MARGRKKGYVNPMKGIKRGSNEYWDIQYNIYLNKRESLKNKGIHFNKEYNKTKFKEVYERLKSRKKTNIISKMVKSQESITYQDAIILYENKNNIKFDPFSKEARNAVNKIYKFVPSEADIKRAEKVYYDKYGKNFSEDKDYSDFIYFVAMIENEYDREELEKDYGY